MESRCLLCGCRILESAWAMAADKVHSVKVGDDWVHNSCLKRKEEKWSARSVTKTSSVSPSSTEGDTTTSIVGRSV